MVEVPKVCSFKGARELVMERVWEKANKLEAKGIPVTHELFGMLIKEEWKRVKEEAAKICPVISLEEVKKMLEETESKTSEVVEKAESSEGQGPVEAKVAVSLRAQKAEEGE